MQARGLEPATLTPLPKRRRGLLFTGIAVLAAGVIGAAVLFVISLSMTEKTVEKFARAPAGCTTRARRASAAAAARGMERPTTAATTICRRSR
jgi:hypothetical protein